MGEDLSPGDLNSFSNPADVTVTHLHLDWDIDFVKKIIQGSVTLNVTKKSRVADKLILDTCDLSIFHVKDNKTGHQLPFKIYDPIPLFGSKMEITLPESSNESYSLTISYKTSPKARALQWLDPQQTAGKKHPYMFSQCQTIHCRSIVPCQDTPSSKFTYTADVTGPEELVVLMGAIKKGDPQIVAQGKKHSFEQKVPIPSYLIAIVVGDLVSRPLGPRSQVWSEKEYVDLSAYEFAETEKMLSTAEEICGPYVWQIYDLLVLPPSFPLGGMEHPCLTFITPTVLAGDRSLADVVAHEISHSWTGNLITNKNYDHFWLNEGFTMFVERKILGKLYGEEARLFSACQGLKDLRDAIETFGEKNPLTQLVVELKNGVNPDVIFSMIPYEKGHTFLYYIEELVGGPEKFDPFLKSYLKEFQYKSIGTEDFKKYLCEYFNREEKLADIDWNNWLYSPGMPPIVPNYATSLEEACIDLKNRWIEWSGKDAGNFSKSDLRSLSSPQIQEFLSLLLMEPPLSQKKLQTMEKVYEFNSNKNAEIHFRWLRLCINSKWEEQIPVALKFVVEQGRMKFVRPIYRDLFAWEAARNRAIETYNAHKNEMMFVTSSAVTNVLNLK